jgi:hypothetical protein
MRVLLAHKPQQERVQALVDYLAEQAILREDSITVARALEQEGPAIAPIIMRRLRSDLASSRLTPGDDLLAAVLGKVGGREVRPFLEEVVASGSPSSWHRTRQMFH